MSRVKRGNVARNRRKKVLKLAKGFRGSLSKLYRPAHQAVLHAGNNAYRDRRRKKRDFRRLWISRIGAALQPFNVSYSVFMGNCQKKNVGVNRKMLAMIAQNHPDSFKEIVTHVTKA